MSYYEKHSWENGETITMPKLNHMEDGIEDSVKYDLILTNKLNGTSFEDLGASDIEVVKGSISDIESILDDGHPVNCLFVYRNRFSFIPSGSNTNIINDYFPLMSIHAPYRFLTFATLGFRLHDETSPFQPTVGMVELRYNSNGTISSVHTGKKTLIATS